MTTPSSDFPISGDAPVADSPARTDSLGVDEQDLDADEDDGTAEDDDTDEDGDTDDMTGTDDTTVGESPDDPGGSGYDDIAQQEILSVDPDEYSDEPHMGSVPRVLGEEEYMPDTQGEDPIYAELGEDGQGDLAPEDM